MERPRRYSKREGHESRQSRQDGNEQGRCARLSSESYLIIVTSLADEEFTEHRFETPGHRVQLTSICIGSRAEQILPLAVEIGTNTNPNRVTRIPLSAGHDQEAAAKSTDKSLPGHEIDLFVQYLVLPVKGVSSRHRLWAAAYEQGFVCFKIAFKGTCLNIRSCDDDGEAEHRCRKQCHSETESD